LLRFENLTEKNDIISANWTKPPIAFVMGCRVGRWQALTSTPVIGPYSLLVANTGFAAVVAPTGFFLANDGDAMACAFYATAASTGAARLGDILRLTLQQMAASMTVGNLQSVSLLGDPALVYRHDVTALGTPTAWLLNYGLTNANADATNRAADGWAVWQDYQAGLSPVTNLLRITGAQAPSNSDGRLRVAFTSASNATYRLQRADSLLATNAWSAISWAWTNSLEWLTAPIPAVAPITSVDAPMTGATREFFRVQRCQ
jgi:hypothetical protein